MDKITDLKGKGTHLQVQGIIRLRGWRILLYTQSLILKIQQHIISNDLIHVMWFYRISLLHRFSRAAPCPKYDTRRGVILSLHDGVLPYLRILVFFCHNLSIVETLCGGCKSMGEDVVASLGM